MRQGERETERGRQTERKTRREMKIVKISIYQGR